MVRYDDIIVGKKLFNELTAIQFSYNLSHQAFKASILIRIKSNLKEIKFSS